MTQSLIRQIIRAHLEESSPARRAATRAIIAQDPSIPTTKTGRVDSLKQLAQYAYDLAEQTKGGPPKYAFTMTSIQKVGINPSTGYNTPVAIYAYPVTPEYVDKLLGGKHIQIGLDKGLDDTDIDGHLSPFAESDRELPFVGDAPFINFFELTDPATTFYTTVGMDESQYRAALDALLPWFKTSGASEDPDLDFRRALMKTQRYHKIGFSNRPVSASEMTPYQRLATIWTLTRTMSKLKAEQIYYAGRAAMTAGETPESAQSDVSLWRTLLILAGVKTVVDDMGKGLIHKQEPVQLAVMDDAVIEPLRQFDNITPAVSSKRKWQLDNDLLNPQTEWLIQKIGPEIDRGLKGQGYTRLSALATIGGHLARSYPARVNGKLKRALQKSGLLSKLAELVSTTPWDSALSEFYPALYDMTGDMSTIDGLLERFVSSDLISYADIKDFITETLSAAIDIDVKNDFIIKLIGRFAKFTAYKGYSAFKVEDFKQFIRDLCRDQDFVIAFGGNASHFIQLMKPLIDMTNDEFEREEILQQIRDLFAMEERMEAEQRVASQTSALRKKYTNKPDTFDLLAQVAPAGLEMLKKRLKEICDEVRYAVATERARISQPENVEKDGGVIAPIDTYTIVSRQLFYSSVAIPETPIHTIADIYGKTRVKLNDLERNQLQTLIAITREDPQVSDKTKAAILDLSNKSLDQIETLINEMESEILAILKPYDVSPEIATAPVYERVLHRLKSRLA
jgi:hypothetical protein